MAYQVWSNTCYSKTHKSSINFILTNKTSSFQLTKATKIGISYVHLLLSTYMRTQTTRLKSKKFLYRNYISFNEKTSFLELESKNLTRNSISSNENYEYLPYQFSDVANNRAPLKKFLRGNKAPFINRHLRKEMYRRSVLRKKFNRKPNKLNWEKYKKQRNKCVELRKRSIKTYTESIT